MSEAYHNKRWQIGTGIFGMLGVAFVLLCLKGDVESRRSSDGYDILIIHV